MALISAERKAAYTSGLIIAMQKLDQAKKAKKTKEDKAYSNRGRPPTLIAQLPKL